MSKKKMPPQLLEHFKKKNESKEGKKAEESAEKGLKAAKAAKKFKTKKEETETKEEDIRRDVHVIAPNVFAGAYLPPEE